MSDARLAELPPQARRGALGWARAHLFGGWASSLTTLCLVGLVVWLAPGLLRYLVIDAVWSAADGGACRAAGAGACWAFIGAKWPFFVYGPYPPELRWRVDLTMALGAALVAWNLWRGAPRKGLAALALLVAYPIAGLALLYGAPVLGLAIVPTAQWGGVFLSLLVAAVGIVFSLPLGVLLAFGRRSKLPIVRMASVGFIEIVRGVPLITVLFMANVMLPLFVPEQWSPDRLLRPLVGVALFASAYMAEVVRAGFQAIPKGQIEGAQALGLSPWRMQRHVVLPQALALVIPNIVNTFIGLFKDTTLVAAVGALDFLRAIDVARLDPAWAGPTIATTGYVFAGLFYFVFCFAMSRYSLGVERRLARASAR